MAKTEKKSLEAFELDDDILNQVNGGITSKQLVAMLSEISTDVLPVMAKPAFVVSPFADIPKADK